MSKTLVNLRSNTRTLLDEAIAADWTNAEVDAAINYAYHEVVTGVCEVFEDFYVATDTFSTKEGQQEYSESDGFPTDFWKMRRVEINYDTATTGSSPSRALPISLDDVTRDLGNTSVGMTSQRVPAYYLRNQGSTIKLGFIPVPDESGTNAIKIWYVQYVADLSAVTDVPNIPYVDRFARLIPYGAAGDLLRKGQQEEGAALRYRNEFEMGLEKMKQQLEDRKADDVKGVTDVVNMDLQFGAPF